MGFKDKAEDWLDNNLPGGKATRKKLEQVGHAALGALASVVFFWVPGAWIILASFGMATGVGVVREYFQNWGDPPEIDTLFIIFEQLPVNADMLIDIGFFSIGGLVFGVSLWGFRKLFA